MSQATPEPTEVTPAETSGLSMPKNIEEMQSLLSGWGQQIVDWLQSPPFLAQVGAIILALFLAPIIAGILRKRVPFLPKNPLRDDFLRYETSFIFAGVFY